MTSVVRGRLLWKLLAVQAVVLVAALVAAWLAIDYLARDSFMALMKQFSIDPASVEEMFRSSTRAALIQVCLIALLAAFGLSFWLTRRILLPLRALAEGSERIAAGDYEFRIDPRRGVPDELDALMQEFNRMAQALERMEQSRKAMVVAVAHELRTPVTNLRGTIEALQDRLLPVDGEALASLHEELLRLQRLTEDLIVAARAGATGEDPMRRVPTDLHRLLERTQELFRACLLRRELKLTLDVDADATPLRVDPDQMQQVFSNLLQNAVQFSPDGSEIRVFSKRENGSVRIVFENAGDAIPSEDMASIFEPYYRVDRSRSRAAGGGAGLGLAIVRGLVLAHGGRVGAESEQGRVRIWVELPV
jgi:two-component system sensor histidine kinase BaeS